MDDFVFTQCAAVPFESAPALEDVRRALLRWEVAGTPRQGSGEHGWALCGPGFIAELRSGMAAVVDVVDRPWPDDPAVAEATPALGAAWTAGAFGPAARPGALSRAADQPWLWNGGADVARRHRGFVRLRTGFALPPEAPKKLPDGYDPLYELSSLTELAGALLHLPGSLALFMPAGEALRSRAQVDAALSRKVGGPPPFELWSNVRAVALPPEGGKRWLLLDVVGMAQLQLPDQEAIFAEGEEDPEAVETLLRNAALHVLSNRAIAPGSTSDDARGRRWRMSLGTGIVAPARRVLRWLPEESARPSDAMLAKLSPVGGAPSS